MTTKRVSVWHRSQNLIVQALAGLGSSPDVFFEPRTVNMLDSGVYEMYDDATGMYKYFNSLSDRIAVIIATPVGVAATLDDFGAATGSKLVDLYITTGLIVANASLPPQVYEWPTESPHLLLTISQVDTVAFAPGWTILNKGDVTYYISNMMVKALEVKPLP